MKVTKHYQFKPLLTLFCLVGFVILCLLGRWQIHRYQFKKRLLATYSHNHDRAAVPIGKALRQFHQLAFLHVKLTGHYDNTHTMLLAHRPHGERTGYQVVTPFWGAGFTRPFLINRGWVPAPRKYGQLPVVPAVTGTVELKGSIKLPEYVFTLGKNILPPIHWPLVMQKVDLKQLASLLHARPWPFTLRLDPKAGSGFVRDWIVTTVTPSRHLSYAVQWFLMALGLVWIYLKLSFVERRSPADVA